MFCPLGIAYCLAVVPIEGDEGTCLFWRAIAALPAAIGCAVAAVAAAADDNDARGPFSVVLLLLLAGRWPLPAT
jgi:hypothetical protein